MLNIKYLVAILSTAFFLINEAVPVPSTNQTSVMQLKQHVKLVKQFQCGTPQLRSYRIKSLLQDEDHSTAIMITPVYTVVSRCDGGTGCCNDSSVCAPNPAGITNKRVEVSVFNIETQKTNVRILQVEHHESCMCRLKTDVLSLSPPPAMTFVS